MIQPLIEAAVARLREELSEVVPASGNHVVAGPVPEPAADALPLLVLLPGRFEVQHAAREPRAGEPRPQATTERFAVDAASPGSRPLAHRALAGTAQAHLVLAEGTVAERRERLSEGTDFHLDPAGTTLHLAAGLAARAAAHAALLARQVHARVGREFDLASRPDLSAALYGDLGLVPPGEVSARNYQVSPAALEKIVDQHPVVPLVLAWQAVADGAPLTVLLEYSFAGVFTAREFRQALLLDVFGADAATAERLGSLATAVLLTFAAELLRSARTEYPSSKTVSTTHQPTAMELVDGEAAAFEHGARLRLAFRVEGQLRLVREVGSYGTIERIRSPGVFADGAVAVEPELG